MRRQGQTPFLVLEGLDGAGTTTQTRLVSEHLQGRDLRVRVTAEPSAGPLGRVAREHVKGGLDLDPRTAALLFTADRSDHLERVVRPARASGAWVVCDRYILSTLAYQGAGGVDPSWLVGISRGFDVPDLTVYLELPQEERGRRLSSRGERPDRYEAPGLQAALQDAYDVGIGLLREAGHRIVRVDGTGSPEAVRDTIINELDALVRP